MFAGNACGWSRTARQWVCVLFAATLLQAHGWLVDTADDCKWVQSWSWLKAFSQVSVTKLMCHELPDNRCIINESQTLDGPQTLDVKHTLVINDTVILRVTGDLTLSGDIIDVRIGAKIMSKTKLQLIGKTAVQAADLAHICAKRIEVEVDGSSDALSLLAAKEGGRGGGIPDTRASAWTPAFDVAAAWQTATGMLQDHAVRVADRLQHKGFVASELLPEDWEHPMASLHAPRALQEIKEAKGIVICGEGTQVLSSGEGMSFVSKGSVVFIGGSANISTAVPEEKIEINADVVQISGVFTTVLTANLHITSTSNTTVASPLPGIYGSRLIYCSLNISSPSDLVMLGFKGGSWILASLNVDADSIAVVPGHLIRTNGTSCYNGRNLNYDPCSGQPGSNLTFDFMMHAKSKVEMQADSSVQPGRFVAGSMLICATSLLLGDHVTIDASGHGCGPGEGRGVGETRNWGKLCGGGGGSHIGMGGSGAKFSAVTYDACALPGLAYDAYDEHDNDSLPTEGASGGACGVPEPCPIDWSSLNRPAHGGGLVWLSAKSICFGSRVQVKADGNAGTTMERVGIPGTMLSGAGAGGQILIFAHRLQFDLDNPSSLSVRGGDATCITAMMGGAGGGGFIGLDFTGKSPPPATSMTVSIDGGYVQENCRGVMPGDGESFVVGHRGAAASLRPCEPGFSNALASGLHSLICQPCPVGKWNADGLMVCNMCKNKPKHGAFYVDEGWTNETCPYKCNPGLPNVQSNPECLAPMDFMLRLIGGAIGAVVILSVLVLVLAYLLWRRASRKRMFALRRDEASVFPAEHTTRRCLLWRLCPRLPHGRHLNRRTTATTISWQVSGDPHPQSFRNEWLPYHVCRVFLSGSNRFGTPWALDTKAPTVLQQYVAPGPWASFASQVNTLGYVSHWEEVMRRILYFACLPLALLLPQLVGSRRARLIRNLVERFSDSHAESHIWQTAVITGFDSSILAIQERSLSSMEAAGEHIDIHQLRMTFGYDDSATLAYLDVFNFQKSFYDWAPANLNREVRVLPAHGNGSALEPYGLRVEDPTLQHLYQGGCTCNPTAFIIMTFNQYARVLRKEELYRADGTHGLQKLQEHVHQRASDFDMGGLVQVLVLPEFPQAIYAQPMEDNTRASVQSHPPPGHMPSFSDLVARQNEVNGRQRAAPERGCLSRICPIGGSGSSAPPAPPAPSQPNVAEGQQAEDAQGDDEVPITMRLCLVFGSAEAIQRAQDEVESFPQGSDSPSSPIRRMMLNASMTTCTLEESTCRQGRGSLAISSPMDHSVLGRLLNMVAQSTEEQIPTRSSLSSLLPCCLRLSPSTVLIIVVDLLFVDLFLFIVLLYSLFKTSLIVGWAWMLVPPFCQPMAIVIGPLFIFLEMPRLGRLYAMMSLASVAGLLTATTLLLILVGSESWFYDLAMLVFVCFIKGGLFVSACTHALNLEAGTDAEFFNLAPDAFASSNPSVPDQESASTRVLPPEAYVRAGGVGPGFAQPDSRAEAYNPLAAMMLQAPHVLSQDKDSSVCSGVAASPF